MNSHIFILIAAILLSNFVHIECEPEDSLVAIKEDNDPNNPPRVYYHSKKRAMLWKVYQINSRNALKMGLYTVFTRGWFDPRSNMGYLYYNSFDNIYNFVYSSLIEKATQVGAYPKTLYNINDVSVGFYVDRNEVSYKAIIVQEKLIPGKPGLGGSKLFGTKPKTEYHNWTKITPVPLRQSDVQIAPTVPVPISPQSVAGPLPEDDADAQTMVEEQSVRSKSRSMTSSGSGTILPVPPPHQQRSMSPSVAETKSSRHTGRSHKSRSQSSSAGSTESRGTKKTYHSFSALQPGGQLTEKNVNSLNSQRG